MRTLTHRIVSAATIVLLLFTWSSCQQEVEEKFHDPECVKLQMEAFEIWQDVSSGNRDKKAIDTALTLIDSAIECDPENFVSITTKAQILFETGQHRPLLEHIERHEAIYDRFDHEGGADAAKVLCYYFLKDTVNFNVSKEKVLKTAKRVYVDREGLYDFLHYVYAVRFYESYESAVELVNSNRDKLQDQAFGPDNKVTWEDFLRKELRELPTFTFDAYDSIAATKKWGFR